MDDFDRDPQASSPSTTSPVPAERKPYHKPAFESERVFETTALACGKITSTQSQCRFNTKAS